MARRRTPRRRTAEAEQYQLYTAFLSDPDNTNKKALSPTSINDYAKAVSAGRKLTEAAREAGCLPKDVESLLAMTDPDQVRAVRDWWEREGQDSLAGYKSHMNRWLAFRGVSSLSPQPPAAAPDLPLQKPPHGVRLRFLLRAFFSEARSLETSDTLKLLCSLTGCQYSLESLREHTGAFRQLRWDLLNVIENAPQETAALLARQYGGSLRSACRNIVTQVLRQHGEQLLTDLSLRRVTYESSLLPPLEALRRACLSGTSHDCAGTFLELLRTVLEDCDPARLSGDPVLSPGDALRDSRLWTGGLLWFWMDLGPLPAGALEVLLPLPWPEDRERRSRLAALLLHSMLALAGKPNGDEPAGWKAADRWMEEAVVFCGQFWGDLSPALAHPPAVWCEAVPEHWLLEGPQNALFRAELLRRQAELLLRMPVEDLPKTRQTVHLVRAQRAIEAGLAILRNRMEDNVCEALELAGAPRFLRQALARLRLLDAQVHRRFGLLETEECCLTDVVGMYIRPSREALADPEAFGHLTGAELAEIAPERARVCRDCFAAYFDKDSAFTKRLRLLPGSDDGSYQEEYGAWRAAFAGLLPEAPVSAPSVHLPLDLDLTASRPVYSGVFDSVLGKALSTQQKPVELSSFQLLGSSQTCLLQMNQVVDNLTTLQMLHVPGFRAACREGFVTLSCFNDIDSPRDYLLQKLRDPNFRFSSFLLPEGAAGKALEQTCRNLLLDYLTGGGTRLRDFPGSCRDLMEFLADSYKLAFDSFQLSDLRRYHQNPSTRYPKRRWTAAPRRTLREVLTERIGLLIQEARLPGSRKDLGKLERLRAQSEREALQNLSSRSAYDTAIDNLVSSEKDPEVRAALEDLRGLVHQSYFISNGLLCCDNILLTERDPDLILEQEAPGVSYGTAGRSDMLEYAYRQAWKPGTRENIGWPDICEIALISRELDLRSEGMTMDQRLAQKERETGLPYQEQGGQLLLQDYTAKLSTGERVHVCPAEAGDQSGQALEMRTVK